MTHSSLTRRALSASLAVTLVFGAAACGDDDSEDEGSEDTGVVDGMGGTEDEGTGDGSGAVDGMGGTDDEEDPRSGIETEGGMGGEDDGAGMFEDPDE